MRANGCTLPALIRKLKAAANTRDDDGCCSARFTRELLVLQFSRINQVLLRFTQRILLKLRRSFRADGWFYTNHPLQICGGCRYCGHWTTISPFAGYWHPHVERVNCKWCCLHHLWSASAWVDFHGPGSCHDLCPSHFHSFLLFLVHYVGAPTIPISLNSYESPSTSNTRRARAKGCGWVPPPYCLEVCSWSRGRHILFIAESNISHKMIYAIITNVWAWVMVFSGICSICFTPGESLCETVPSVSLWRGG